MNTIKCPCNSNQNYQNCCGPLHQGTRAPSSAVQLMRSRYTAFVMQLTDYLLSTLHPSQRHPDEANQIRQTLDATQWLGLTIISETSRGNKAEVEFLAFYAANPVGQLHERSRFIHEDNKWFYLDGDILKPVKLSRNDLCFCGSGLKLKRCHVQL